MSYNAYPARSNVPERFEHRLRLLGANDANPTVEYGSQGVTVTRSGEGAYTIDFAENPGTFVGWEWAFGAATPADMKGYTAVRDTWDTATYSLAIVVYNSSFAAADVIANQYLDLCLIFARSSVTG